MAERREWTVWHPDDTHPDAPDEAECGPWKVQADCPEEAAEKFVERHCLDDCDCYDGYLRDGVTLYVRGADGLVYRVHVRGTQDVVFIGRRAQ